MATATQTKAEVLRDFKRFTPDQKVTFGDEVISEMTEHASVFTDPKIAIADLTLINNTLRSKNLAAATGDKEAIADRDNYLPTWDDAFDQDADYVQLEANGNTTIIEQSGYHSSKTEFNNAIAPNKLLVDAGGNKEHGSIYYKAEAAGHHASYLSLAVKENGNPIGVQMVVDGNVLKINVNGTELFIQPSTQRKGNFNGLTPRGAEVNVVVLAFNAAGISPVSEPVSVTIP